jgi:hypothetical protein
LFTIALCPAKIVGAPLCPFACVSTESIDGLCITLLLASQPNH